MLNRFTKLNHLQKKLLIFNSIIRTIFPLWVFINPIQGIIIALITDGYDYYLLCRYGKISNDLYQYQDKILDYYWYVLILIYTYLYIPSIFIQLLLLSTFVFRSLGQLIYMLNHNEGIFLYFPNIQEPIFWLWIIYPSLLDQQLLFISVTVIVLIKIIIEYYVHIIHVNPVNQLLHSLGIKSNL